MPRKRGKKWTAWGYDPATKKKKYLGTRDTAREARQLEADWVLSAKSTSRETCDGFAQRWTTDYPRREESTNKHNAERVKRFARDFAGVRMADVDRPSAREWALRHKAMVPAVRAMFSDALRDGLVAINPFAQLRLPGSKGRKDIVALTEQELHELADFALDPRMELGEFGPEYRAMILFAGYTGIRPGELFALKRSDVNGRMATIERSFSSATRKIKGTKTGQVRTVIVPPVAEDALLDVPEHEGGPLFCSPMGKRFSQSLHNRYWEKLRLIANRPGFDFYELRHAAATMLLERGVSPWDVAVQLGHTDGGQLVMDLYGHPSEAGARQRILGAWDREAGPVPITKLKEAKSA